MFDNSHIFESLCLDLSNAKNADIKKCSMSNVTVNYGEVENSVIENINISRSVVRNAEILKSKDLLRTRYNVNMANIHNMFDIVFFPDAKCHKYGYASAGAWYYPSCFGRDSDQEEFDDEDEKINRSIIYTYYRDREILEKSYKCMARGIMNIIYNTIEQSDVDLKDIYLGSWAMAYSEILMEYLLCHYDCYKKENIDELERQLGKIDITNKKLYSIFGIIDVETMKKIFDYLKIKKDEEEYYINKLKSKGIIIINKNTLKII